MNLYYVAAEIPKSRRRLRTIGGSPFIYVTPNYRIAKRRASELGMSVFRIEFKAVGAEVKG